MKNKVAVFITIISLLLITGCASKPKEKTIKSFCEMYIGEYTMDEASNLSAEDYQVIYLSEKVTNLRIDNKDGADYYEGTCLKNMSLTKMQELMGREKFAAYWAACVKISELQKNNDPKGSFMQFVFKNGDYISVAMDDYSVQDMNMTAEHSQTNEKVDIFWMLPITFKL
ncbi:MAG: hypothetical protein K6A89_04930 [Treponema sp.]|nr:hypothetical protein [Treponema sp.]